MLHSLETIALPILKEGSPPSENRLLATPIEDTTANAKDCLVPGVQENEEKEKKKKKEKALGLPRFL